MLQTLASAARRLMRPQLSNSQTMVDIARSRSAFRDNSSKIDGYYQVYERYFAQYRGKRPTIFEIGTWAGESLKVFSRYFADGKIIGVDLDPKPADYTEYNNIHFEQGDQRDRTFLEDLGKRYAPRGIDIVVDDASHVGANSLLTFEALFPLVAPGGMYVVEDWGTGYFPEYIDGAAFEPMRVDGRAIKSHDAGMVGLVKHFVDFVAGSDTRYEGLPKVSEMHVHFGMVFLRKGF